MTPVFLVLLLLLPVSALADDLIGVEFVRCFDGDTCTVDIRNVPAVFGKHLGVRLRGIDAPEIHGKCHAEITAAIAARDYLQDKMQRAKTLNFKDPKRDKYFRLDVTIIADGVDLNQEMVATGHARAYDGRQRQSWCHQ